MAKPLLLGGVLGGLVAFLWSALSWMVLPWHEKTMKPFKDEKAVAAVLLANAEQNGVYFLPSEESQVPKGPLFFGAFKREGIPGLAKEMISGAVLDIIAAVIIAWLLLQTSARSYMGNVVFVAVVALAAGFLCRMPDWNWWNFSAAFTLVSVVDLVIGWFLAGLVIARVARPSQ